MMHCYCDYDYDYPEFSRTTKPRARRPHRCVECGTTIQPGEQYERVAGVWEGEFSTFCICERCHDLRQWVKNNVPCFCWAYGNMIEDARECIEDAVYRAPEETRGLAFGFGRRLVAIKRAKKRARAGEAA
jgi:hypothetical protein